MEAFLGIIIGVLVTLGGVTYFKGLQKKKLANSQSVILLEKITSKKKALVVINAKAHVGFDFSKVKMEANANSKTVVLQHFPRPEVLSIETNLNYYDKKDGYFNKFEATDLTELHSEAKKHIQDKIPESGLYEIAGKEAIETILLIENIVQTIGWKLDYSSLNVETKQPKHIK